MASSLHRRHLQPLSNSLLQREGGKKAKIEESWRIPADPSAAEGADLLPLFPPVMERPVFVQRDI